MITLFFVIARSVNDAAISALQAKLCYTGARHQCNTKTRKKAKEEIPDRARNDKEGFFCRQCSIKNDKAGLPRLRLAKTEKNRMTKRDSETRLGVIHAKEKSRMTKKNRITRRERKEHLQCKMVNFVPGTILTILVDRFTFVREKNSTRMKLSISML